MILLFELEFWAKLSSDIHILSKKVFVISSKTMGGGGGGNGGVGGISPQLSYDKKLVGGCNK